MNRLPLIPLVTLLVGAVLPGTAWSQPSLTRSLPAAIPPGQATQVTLYGAKLEGASQVWTSFPADVEILPGGSASQVVCKLTLPPETPLGVGGVVVSTAAGASGVLLLAVDDMPSVVDNGKNHRLEEAQPLEWPVAVDGLADGTQADHYRVEGKAGQQIAVEVYAARLDSPMDPVLRLLNAQGGELRMSDDEPGLGADGRWEYTFPQDGTYFLQVHDNRYRAGGSYRLRVGDFPLVSTALPLGARRGSTAHVSFAVSGESGETSVPSVVSRVLDAPRVERWGVAARRAGGKSSALTPLVVSDLPERVEREPNDEPPAALEVVIPTAVSGQLQTEGDTDLYAFHAVSGQRLEVRGTAARLGSPSVPLLKILSADGKTLAESKYGEVADPSLTFTAPAKGRYYLHVQELLDRGGPEYSYRVELAAAAPFSLSLRNDKNSTLNFTLPSGNGAVALPLDCVRSGYDGPIDLALEDASTGLRLLNATIGEKANAAQPLLVVPARFQPGDLRAIRLVGSATIDGRPVTQVVSTAAVVRAQRPRISYVPRWLDGRLTLAATAGPAAAPFALAPQPAEVELARPLGSASCRIQPQRTDKEFKDPLQVFVDQLPPGIEANVTKEGKEPDETYVVAFQASADCPPSLNPVRVTFYGAFKGKAYAVDQLVPLRVFEPLRVRASLPAAIQPGQKQTLTVQVTRDGGDPQPVKLQVEGLPATVTGTAEVTIPADQNEAQVELTATGEAAAGTHPLTVRAGTTYREQPVSVQAPPVELQIAKP